MTNLTAEQIAGIKAASENATPGPWRVYEDKSETVYVRNALGTRTMGLNYYSGDAKHIANCDPQTISVLCDLALRGLAPLPEGYALVPIEPTPEMIGAFWRQKNAGTQEIGGTGPDTHDYAAYRAMIAASPAIPTARDGGATHRHKKRGTEYVLLGIGKMQADGWIDDTRARTGVQQDGPHVTRYREVSSVDMREVAVYRSADDGSLWVRPREDFEDGRFEALSNGAQP